MRHHINKLVFLGLFCMAGGLIQGEEISGLAMAFHRALISGLAVVVAAVSGEYNITRVALSGGCFQNMILLRGLHFALEQKDLSVYINRQVPPNDGGISLGQAYWGLHNCEK